VKALPGCTQVPFMFKYAVDALTADPSGAVLAATPLMHMVPAAALLGYGAARATSSLCNELRNAVFAKARPAAPALLPCAAKRTLGNESQSGAEMALEVSPPWALDRGTLMELVV